MNRYFFAAAAAVAMLLAGQKASAAPVTFVESWTGCYLGGNVGYGWSPTKWSDPASGIEFASHTADGAVGGGQIGCDYQLDPQWVVGIRGMWDAAGLKGSSANALNPALTDTSKVTWIATLTGRVGYVVEPRTMLYVQAGAAWAHAKYTECCTPPTPPPPPIPDGFANVTRSGWTVGGGLEHKFTPHLSAFIEYDYIGLGGDDVTFTPTPPTTTPFVYHIEQNIHLILVGLNYRFGPFP